MSTELATGGPGRRPRRVGGPQAAPRSGAGRCVRREPASFAEVLGVFDRLCVCNIYGEASVPPGGGGGGGGGIDGARRAS